MAWIVLVAYGLLFWVVLPWSRDRVMFFEGRDERGNRVGFWLLTGSGVW
ncbi:hypothetical protein MYX78_06735 [Acidobacteria bacterium AH-259-G07]|nr:hypothetical protein [Acidobacteria bacterium AH-259-G07]